ncbi:MAG: hypothetical protein JWL59_4452 [Chthoniobacteraceae bacterium]|nr:hypothetical protein [Chthoniobacteraceae bacterium]
MSALPAPNTELLAPLSLFRRKWAAPMPDFEWVDSAFLPEPYRTLLVHNGDMTSRLEAFHGGEIVLEVLHCEHTPIAYRREVVLHMEATGMPIEYGAIEIHLEAFEGELRELIVAARLPLGGLLNRFGIDYHSEPKAFIRLGADPVMREHFQLPDAGHFYGRCNVLLDSNNRELARIVELLRP